MFLFLKMKYISHTELYLIFKLPLLALAVTSVIDSTQPVRFFLNHPPVNVISGSAYPFHRSDFFPDVRWEMSGLLSTSLTFNTFFGYQKYSKRTDRN